MLVLGSVHAAPQRGGKLPKLGLVACQSAAARFGVHAGSGPSPACSGRRCMGRGHTCTPAWEVPNDHLAVHTGRRTPKHDGSDDRTVGVASHGGEQSEKGQRTEAIERPGGGMASLAMNRSRDGSSLDCHRL